MHDLKKKMTAAAIVAATCALTACGGGGGGSGDATGGGSVNPPVQASALAGRWTGGAGTRTLQTHTLADGSVWGIYSEDNSALHGGFFHVQAGVSGNHLSGTGKDFNMDGGGITASTFAADVTPKQSITGTATGSRAMSFGGSYESEFEQTPTLAAVAGAYLTTVTIVSTTSLASDASVGVDASGAVTGSVLGGCSFTGQLTPRTDANAFDLSLSFTSACPQGASTATGIAYYQPTDRVLKIAAASSNETAGVLALLFRAGGQP